MRWKGVLRFFLAAAAAAAWVPDLSAGTAGTGTPEVSLPPAVFRAPAGRRAPAATLAAPVLSGARLPESARHALPPLSPEERAALRRRAERGPLRRKVPAVRVGIARALPQQLDFDGSSAVIQPGSSRPLAGGLLERGADGRLTWTASFSSAGAGALRLHFRSARLPPGGQAFVYGAGGQVHGPYVFDSGARPEGFWSHTVFGEEIVLQVQFGLAGRDELEKTRLTIASLVHLEHPAFAPTAAPKATAGLRPKAQECFVDASCVTAAEFPNLEQASRAVGQLNFVDGGFAFICTGALIHSTAGTTVPYLLTANHCFSDQPAATSLEVFWQYRTASCNGPFPNPNLFPRTLGSTLLATGETSDFTLVQLSQDPPDDSVFLGWTTDDVSRAGGTVIHRLSYPDGNPQFYTRHLISSTPTPVFCEGAEQGNFIYSKDVTGGTGGGSSGSPVYLGDLRVVGQELGSCGINVDDDCDVLGNSTLDGAFRVTFPFVQPWLSPGVPGPCTPGPATLCLNNGRFRATVAWATAVGNNGAGTGVTLTGDSGYFWFFNPANIELVVKVLDACSVAGRFWVFAGGLTNVDVLLTVEDTQTGAVQIYHNPLGTAFAPLQDTQAFLCP